MPRQKFHRDRVYYEIGEPRPGAAGIGYVRYSSDLQPESSLATQKRLIKDLFDKKGWRLLGWREEPERSANNYLDDLIIERPVFAQLLNEAEQGMFQVVVCAYSNRWARSMEVGYASLTRLRRARIWWCTADGLWDIDKVQQDGFNVAFAVDMSINEAYSRELSKRTIAGKEDRARDGYHNGSVSFGYLRPIYPKGGDDAPSTYRPPRTPVRIDPETFPALVRIGELVAQGWSDRAIADELERDGYVIRSARFGERFLTKDTIAAIRRSWFPRELEPGSGFGTIETPSGELVVGKHPAAWPYELWQRMVEVKDMQYRRPTKAARKRPHEFSRIIVCATCLRPLRVTFGNAGKSILPYYRDTSHERKLPCTTARAGFRSVRSSLVMMQFGDVLKRVELPDAWREMVTEICQSGGNQNNEEAQRIQRRRTELEERRKRLNMLFLDGHITQDEHNDQMQAIHTELFELSVPLVADVEKLKNMALSAGETLSTIADYWDEALPEERRDIVWSLLNGEGLIYDLERHAIVGLKPRPSVLPVLALGLECTGMWEQRDGGLWLREDYWPPRLEAGPSGLPSRPPALTLSQQEQAIMMLRQGRSLREIAKALGVSHESVRRLAQREDIVLPSNGMKLTPEQQQEALALLQSDVPFREVAGRFGVAHETIRRLALRDGVELAPKGQKLTPTARKLTPEQQQQARELVAAGVSIRKVASQFGVSRQALGKLING